MRVFFKPWRRKVSVLTLGLACVFAAIWIRCQSNCESYWSGNGRGYVTNEFRTSPVGLLWVRTSTTVPDPGNGGALRWDPGWRRLIPGDSDPTKLLFRDRKLKSRWHWGGFDVGELDPSESMRIGWWLFPHWSFVVPLTLLAAYLLLSKPRQAKKPEPPQPTEPDDA